MRLRVRHVIRYHYSKLVFCEPMIVRLRPRDDNGQVLEYFSLEIWPRPCGTSDHRDLEGNIVTKAWFSELTQCLAVSTTSIVETHEANPFAFLLSPDAVRLPVHWSTDDQEHARLYLTRGHGRSEVDEYASSIAKNANHDTVTFVTHLAARIQQDHAKISREQGDPWEPVRTLSERCGSCRDLSVLFIDACRSQGLPARFVSGYAWNDDANEDQELHAWAEVYLPGAGWRPFDPSSGLAVSDRHISIAVGREPSAAAPTVGSFRSDGANSRLETQVIVRAGLVGE